MPPHGSRLRDEGREGLGELPLLGPEAGGEGWRLGEADLRAWLDALIRSGTRVVAPVAEDGLLLFREVSSSGQVMLTEGGNSRWSPKELLFPATEELFSYVLAPSVELHEPPRDERPVVLFAVRPCDAAGLCRLDEVFLADPADPAYAARREQATVVSLLCDSARPECFCIAVGVSPGGREGVDVQLAGHDGGWLLRPLTPKGTDLVAGASSHWLPASADDWERVDERLRALQADLDFPFLPPGFAERLEGSFQHPLWQAVGERCLGCGVCAYVCPSCSCFDLGDEGSAVCGSRCRVWDSCAFARFTLHASGHNPRPTRATRYRQRVLHKFAYFPLDHGGRPMCVGCGRCLALCPAGLDIRRAVEQVVAAAEEGR